MKTNEDRYVRFYDALAALDKMLSTTLDPEVDEATQARANFLNTLEAASQLRQLQGDEHRGEPAGTVVLDADGAVGVKLASGWAFAGIEGSYWMPANPATVLYTPPAVGEEPKR